MMIILILGLWLDIKIIIRTAIICFSSKETFQEEEKLQVEIASVVSLHRNDRRE